MKFRRTWFPVMTDDGLILDYEPAINVNVAFSGNQPVRWTFLVDNGSDISLASRELCELLGIPWDDGEPLMLSGITPREECQVMGRVHNVAVSLDEVGQEIVIPICFASGPAPSLIGRRGFFDAFRIEFDQPYRTTTFWPSLIGVESPGAMTSWGPTVMSWSASTSETLPPPNM